jgi:adenylate cyclase
MMPSAAASLATWISQVGLVVADETEFLSQLYARVCDAGLPLSKAIVFVDTLHPIYEGRVQRWEAQAGTARALDYEADRRRTTRAMAEEPVQSSAGNRRDFVASAN